MACCVIGVAVTAAFVWTARFVRHRLLGKPEAPEPAAWRLTR
jgi:hypothetical protein